MKARQQFFNHLGDQFGKMAQISTSLEHTLGASLFGLVHNRVSAMNGCTFCLDMDVKKAKLRGESQLKMFHIPVWRESELFDARERAALEWAEAVTKLSPEGVSDEVYNRVREHFSEAEMSALTMAIGIVNVWNRLNIAFRNPPGGMDKMLGLDKADLK